MNTKHITRERISALADGELSSDQAEAALTALREKERQADWEIYHQIGDVLRSDDMAVRLSSGFAARMAARLELEPVIIAPASMNKPEALPEPDVQRQPVVRAKHSARRWALPGMAAAVAAVAFITMPQLMVAMKMEPANATSQMTALAAGTPSEPAVVSASAPEGVVLRDPGIDDYLLAHQRFSPSLYSTAQYARSATFAADSNK